MAGLQGTGDDAPSPERCALCGGAAAGPCAHCGRSVCGDCCELTSGGVKTYAVCTVCVRRGGTSVGSAWWSLLVWVLGFVAVLVAIAGALSWLG